jgi:hypothetical protein
MLTGESGMRTLPDPEVSWDHKVIIMGAVWTNATWTGWTQKQVRNNPQPGRNHQLAPRQEIAASY